MSSIIKVDQIQLADGSTPTAGDLGLNTTGSVLQVVSTSSTSNISTTSATYTAVTGLSASITPSSTSSKILIIVNINIFCGAANTEGWTTIYRNGSNIGSGSGAGFASAYAGASDLITQSPMVCLDSPNSSTSVTYAVYFKRFQGSSTVYSNIRGMDNTITLMEIAG